MKKLLFTLTAALLITAAFAQGSLQFSQALIVDNTLSTVPANKVWKVTAVYGVAGSYCANVYNLAGGGPTSGRPWSKTSATFFEVNGNQIYSSVNQNSDTWYTASDCVTSAYTYTNSKIGTVVAPNPNMLPMWLPAGATLKGGTADIFVSVLEFDIIP